MFIKAVLLGGAETWRVSKQITGRVQVFVNRCLHFILRIRWPLVIGNEDPWEITNQERMATQICRRKWRWIGHTLEKTQDYVTRQALFWNPQGRRKRDRPKLAWKPSVDQELRQSRSDWQKIARQAKDCSEWCAFVDALCSPYRSYG